VRRTRSVLATLGLAVGTTAVVLLIGDRALGGFGDGRFTALGGAPYSRTVLVRPEFRVPVRTNAAGFRGGPLPGPKPPGVYRIVALGDSFTFGFGVREDQAWPARLAAALNHRLHGTPRVEVVNLGVPGTGPRDYLWHLAHTGLALEPDMVVVGLFANDVNDVYQLDRFGVRSPLYALAELRAGGLAPRPWWKRAANAALPNLYALAGRTRARLAASPREAYAATAVEGVERPSPRALVAALGARYGRPDAMLARYADLAPGPRAALDGLLAGEPLGDDVQPAVLLAALVDPDAEADGVLLRSAGRRAAWDETAAILGRLVGAARARDAATVLVVIPAGEQIDRARWPTLEAVGFHLDPTMLTDATLAEHVRVFGAAHAVPVVDLLSAFRAHRGAGLYYTEDEHWNARGQAFAAARLATALAPRIGGRS
jgi:lysophospholipase L1-like esterase